jgi:hypothetical protein
LFQNTNSNGYLKIYNQNDIFSQEGKKEGKSKKKKKTKTKLDKDYDDKEAEKSGGNVIKLYFCH